MPRNSPAAPPVLRRAGGDLAARTGPRDWRRPIQIGLVVLLLLDLLFFVLAFRPAGQSFAEQKQALDRLRSDIGAHRETVERLRKIEASLASARSQGDEFYRTRFLPQATGFSTIMEEVDKLVSATGVRKGTVNYAVAEVKDRSDLEEVEITTSLEGEYSKMVQFINRLEQSSLFLIVDSLGVAGGSGRSGVKLSVRLVTYFRVS